MNDKIDEAALDRAVKIVLRQYIDGAKRIPQLRPTVRWAGEVYRDQIVAEYHRQRAAA